VRTLLDEQFAPITSEIGFLRLPFARTATALTRWRREQHPRLRTLDLHEPLRAALDRLPPLEAGAPRALLVAVRGGWCAYFDSAPDGTHARPPVAHLTRALRCDGLRVVSVPHTAARPGVVHWELLLRTDWASEVREVDLRHADGRWQFSTRGPVQPYEEVEEYHTPRVRDRFTSAMLERYCRALGLDLFDPDAYGPDAVWLEHQERPAWWSSVRRLVPGALTSPSLAESQRRLGIVPGAARELPG